MLYPLGMKRGKVTLMKYIKSCGFVAYRQIRNENHYLIIKSLNGDVGFPKGHTEPGESEIETAIRELKEETGITVEVVQGFRRQIEYKLPRTADAIKLVVYFLGKCSSDDLIPQESEVAWAKLVSYQDALNILTFEETKNILKDAEEFIRSDAFSS